MAKAKKLSPHARAYHLFRSGMDTVEIAHALGVSEAWASRWVHEERCAQKGVRIQYEQPASAGQPRALSEMRHDI